MTSDHYAKITDKDINSIESEGIKSLNPIPITSEILKKCGFEFSNGLFRTGNCSLEYAGWHSLYLKTGYVGSAFRYLHQLQNLYFEVTGEELQPDL
jgi:hypothetical protein